MKTTIQVDKEIANEVQRIRVDLGLKNANQAIRYLIDYFRRPGNVTKVVERPCEVIPGEEREAPPPEEMGEGD